MVHGMDRGRGDGGAGDRYPLNPPARDAYHGGTEITEEPRSVFESLREVSVPSVSPCEVRRDNRAHVRLRPDPAVDARALFPLTCRHLGAAAPPAKSAAEFVEAVRALNAKGDIPARAARDLVRYEASLQELRPSPASARGPAPADHERVVLSPHVRVLVFGGGLPEMLDALRAGRSASPRPSRGWIVAWLSAEGKLQELILPREEGWVLERFRAPTTPDDALDEDEREEFARLWELGIIVRA